MEFKKQNKQAWGKRERGKPRNTLLTIENKLTVVGGEVGRERAKWVMSIKEGTCDEHWVLYVSDESVNSIPETNMHCMLTNLNINLNTYIHTYIQVK